MLPCIETNTRKTEYEYAIMESIIRRFLKEGGKFEGSVFHRGS